MIDRLATIDRAAIQSMTSDRADRIYLPYEDTGDILYIAEKLILEHIGQGRRYHDNILNHSSITAYLVLQPSHTKPRAGFVIDVDTPDGQRLHKSIYTPSGSETAAEILVEFFGAGAPGLRADIRRSYERQHQAFLEQAIFSGGAGLRPELHDFCQAFTSAVHAGMTPKQIMATITE